MRRLLAHRLARRYLAGQVLSLLGDSALWMACGIWVRTLTGSNGAAGLTFFFFTVPAVVAPVFGLVVDRVRRARLLIVANLAGALVLTPLLLVHHASQVWLIYAVMLLYGALNLLIAPAQSALLAGLLPGELLADANGLLRTAQEGLRIVAPLAGAGLFVVLGPTAVVLLDMATFVAAAGFCLALRYREERPAPARTHLLTEVAAGVRFLGGHRVLRRVTVATAVATLVVGFGESAGFAVVTVGLGKPAAYVGVFQVVAGVGAIAAGLLAAPAVRRIGEVRVVAAGLVAFAVGMALETTGVLPVVLGGRMLSGAGLPWIVIALLTLLQRLAPGNLQGRVYAAFEVSTTVPQALSIAFGAYLVTVLDYRIVLAVEAVVLVVAALLLPRRTAATGRAADPKPVSPAPAIVD